MDHGLKDVLRCHMCDTSVPSLYCNSCNSYLCKTCEEKHLSDALKEHIVVSSDKRRSTPRCQIHSFKICERFCEQCGIPICMQCICSEKHRGHGLVDITKHIQTRKDRLKADLQELQDTIYPKYKEIASYLQNQKADLDLHSQNLTTTINKNGEFLHREIESIIKYQIAYLNKMDYKLLSIINTHENEISRISSEIIKCTADLKELMDSNDVSRVSAYKSRNAEFRKMPPKLTISLTSITPQKYNKKQLYEQFGFLIPFENTTEENGYTMESPGAESSAPDRPLIDVPQIITKINTEYEYNLRSVSCLSDEEIWTCAYDKKIRLYNLRGELVKLIQTKLENKENKVWGISVTKSGNLVYTNKSGRTVNIVNDTKIETVIRLQGWKPGKVCNTSFDDLLVVMDSDDGKQTKVVRYSGSSFKETQSIQYDNKGQPLYSSHGYNYNKFISENRNLDICVSDYQANAVVVVNQAGKLRFTYTGPSSTTKGSFIPCDITTDSQGRILTADYNNHCIHILDQDGQFLRYIDNCDLQLPWGLCVDNRDNLFVAEWRTCKVKKIRYCM